MRKFTSEMERRTFLRLGLGSLGGMALAGAPGGFRRDPASAQPAPGPFAHGVASGDPLPGGVILWTRVTPAADATPGSGLGPPVEVGWEVATDDAFTCIAARGDTTTNAASDHTVKVDVGGLQSATTYHYRFTALGATSPTGRTRTAPAAGADVAALRFGVVSCSNWEGGYFSAYRHLAARDDLDAVVHLGDYLYEYPVGGYGPGAGFGRVHEPETEMVTLEDYRRRHALYKTDPDLQALHHHYAFVTTIDDHEVTDNSWADGAHNHTEATEATEGDYHQRRAAALQAYFEWMPIRATGGADEPTRIWRQLAFGGLADLFMLDERTYRSAPPEGASDDLFVTSDVPDDPDRTMLGSDQLAFLTTGLSASAATWKLLGNGVMFAPLVLADPPDPLSSPLTPVFEGLGIAPPVVLNGDQWDGYRAEQRSLGAAFGEAGGVVILTGDIHSSWAAEIPADPATYLPGVGGPTTAVEFVTPAVTSDSFSAALSGAGIPAGEQLAAALPTVATTAGPWFKYLDAEHHGFGVLEVTPAHVQYDWYHLSDRTDPDATAAFAAAFETLAGTNTLRPAAQLGPRAATGGASCEAPTPTASTPALVSRAAEPAAEPAAMLADTGPTIGLAVPAAAATAATGLALAAVRRSRLATEPAPDLAAGATVPGAGSGGQP